MVTMLYVTTHPRDDEQSYSMAVGRKFVVIDKYVFVTPICNYSYLPLMKAYLDTICNTGKTFKYYPYGSVAEQT